MDLVAGDLVGDRRGGRVLDVLTLGIEGRLQRLGPLAVGAGVTVSVGSDVPQPPAGGVRGAMVVAALDDEQRFAVEAHGGCLAVVVPVEAERVAAVFGEAVSELGEDRIAVIWPAPTPRRATLRAAISSAGEIRCRTGVSSTC